MANNLQKGNAGPMRLYVGSLHFNITEEMLRGIFEPFGRVRAVVQCTHRWHICFKFGEAGSPHTNKSPFIINHSMRLSHLQTNIRLKS